MSVHGLKKIAAAIKRHQRATDKGVRKGLLRAGLFLQRESQKIVPIEFGFLRASAQTVIKGRGKESEVRVSYGGTGTVGATKAVRGAKDVSIEGDKAVREVDYAVHVHENTEARHKPGKSAKFLEKPLREKRDRIGEIVVEGIQEELP